MSDMSSYMESDMLKSTVPAKQSASRLARLGIAGAAAMVLIIGCKQSAESGAPAQQSAPTPEVSVVSAASQRVELHTSLPGRTAPYRVAEIRPQVSGIILKRLFEEGSEVKEGQQLYQIDPATYKAAFDSANAMLARAEAVLKSATLTVNRYKKLDIGRDVSTQDYDNAVAAQLQAEAEVLSAKAAIQTARINLDYTKVNSPISGRAGRSVVTEGALVTANQATALVTIQQLDPIYVDVTQSTSQLLQLKRSLAAGRLQSDDESRKQVHLLLDNDEAYAEPGTLQFRDVTVDPTTGSVVLRLVFPNPKQTLLPGMFVRATVEEGVQPSAILIPQQAVSRDTKGNPLVLLVVNGKVEQHQIALDRAIGDKWLVASGLSGGEQIVVEGMQKVRPGASVKAVPFVEGAAKSAAR